jgi:hypothetical protein
MPRLSPLSLDALSLSLDNEQRGVFSFNLDGDHSHATHSAFLA